ncbi:MAG: hypothetical protein HFJ60_00750 [Clostridia bacterium]|jgi:hypothetical protein|nr:hypothetical protein [Clostridia bacterium]
MKVKEKFLLSIIGISAICLILNPIKSKAALQANGNTGKTDTINNWLINIRKMEAIGGTLGLAAGINGNLTDSGETNNIDIHMQKNTEYGAMAILSASAYGNQKKIADGETTTGNKSGIYIFLNIEWVVAGINNFNVVNFKNAEGKYKNIYTNTYVAKIGDAITETRGWHGSNYSDWNIMDSVGILRAYQNGIFAYRAQSKFGDRDSTWYTKPWFSRAVIVVGNGF